MRKILYVQYTDPSAYPPLEHSSLILANRGWDVRFIGAEAGGAARALELPRHPAITVHLMRERPRGLRQLLHFARFLAWCRAEVKRFRPDVVYCSDLMSYPVGLWATSLGRVRTVMHEHDPPPAVGGGPYLDVLRAMRRRFARRASHVIIPQDERARRFIAETGCEAAHLNVVYNCPSRRELSTIQFSPPKPTSGLSLWFHGTIGAELVPLTIVDALAQLPGDVRFELAGYETIGSKGYAAAIMERARTRGVADRIVFHGAVPLRADLLRMAARADVGLALFANRFRDPMVGASNKPFDYLACGLPLVTNRTPEWEAFFGSRNLSIGCDPEDPSDIARAILILRNNPLQRQAMAERGRELIRMQWNYELQFEPVLRVLEASLDPESRHCNYEGTENMNKCQIEKR